MKIKIYHTADSVDPGETCGENEIENVIDRLEAEYKNEIEKEYPGAEVEFYREDNTRGIKVEFPLDIRGGMTLDFDYIEDDICRICGDVYETGNFW